MIDSNQLKDTVIVPTLKELGLYSETAVNLLLGTCAQESHMGKYLKQIKGPARGIFQMEPNTHNDIWNNYLIYKPELAEKIKTFSVYQTSDELVWNLKYAAAMSRIFYLRIRDPLPQNKPISLGLYWKKYYNTVHGKGTVQEFISNYARFVK